MIEEPSISSSGHKLGQIIGDWYEEHVALPVLAAVAKRLNLYLASRFTANQRGEKRIIWQDVDGNAVDYDFVMELGGTESHPGIPVAFFETFWRRGARHSKDKARDDTGKLLPMKETFPTARVLCILAAGDFTNPAREYVKSRGVELFHIPKAKILQAWAENGLTIDYPDRASEAEKAEIVNTIDNALTKNPEIKKAAARKLVALVGETTLKSFENLLLFKLGATPQEYKITIQQQSDPIIFSSYKEFDEFLSRDIEHPELPHRFFLYEVVFADGDSFVRGSLSLDDLTRCHNELKQLIVHAENLVCNANS